MTYRIVIFLIIIFFTGLQCTGTARQERYVTLTVLTEDNEISNNWGAYLHHHLKKRTKHKKILLNQSAKKAYVIRISVDADYMYDYCVDRKEEEIAVSTKDEQTMIWLIYQLISYLASEINDLDVSDLPPPLLSFDTECRSFDLT